MMMIIIQVFPILRFGGAQVLILYTVLVYHVPTQHSILKSKNWLLLFKSKCFNLMLLNSLLTGNICRTNIYMIPPSAKVSLFLIGVLVFNFFNPSLFPDFPALRVDDAEFEFLSAGFCSMFSS